MNAEQGERVRQLLTRQRWAALATQCQDGSPSVSHVAYVAETDFNGFLLHVSKLAAHTRNLLARPAVSLAVSEPDNGEDDPQLLARLTINGTASEIPRHSEDYLSARQRYLMGLPWAERLFGFEDFVLVRVFPQTARFVGGFAQTLQLTAEQLRRLATL